MRQARDPIEYIKKLLLDHSLASADELKSVEKDIRASVQVCVLNSMIIHVLYVNAYCIHLSFLVYSITALYYHHSVIYHRKYIYPS